MKRKIKFRAWDVKKNKMVSWSCIYRKQYIQKYLCSKFYIPMQFTGVNDKYRQEIYEGDIVKFIDENGPGEDLIDVVDDMTLFLIDCEYGGVTFAEELSKIEKLGNVYETPELIEENT